MISGSLDGLAGPIVGWVLLLEHRKYPFGAISGEQSERPIINRNPLDESQRFGDHLVVTFDDRSGQLTDP